MIVSNLSAVQEVDYPWNRGIKALLIHLIARA